MNYLSRFSTDKSLKAFSTFGIGGPAKYFMQVTTIEDMQGLLAYCHRENIPFFILGKGSNCLFDDRGFDGLVILNKICFCEITGSVVHVGAGYSFSLLGVQTARKGLSGLEFASGIPASVGGAVFMNAGANKQETKDHIVEVTFVNEKGDIEIYPKEKMHFSYRTSIFQEKKGAIVSARFALSQDHSARQKQLSIIEYRTKTQPYGEKSAGCVFRNPLGSSAGALIEKSGLKGEMLGGAAVSELHANFIINKENALASDVLCLAKQVQERVQKTTGVELEMEVRCIPYQMKN